MKKIAWLESSSQADFVYSIFNRRLFDLSAIGIVDVIANDNLQLTVAEHLLALHFLIACEGADGCCGLFALEGDDDFAIGATCCIADYACRNGEGVGLILLESDSSNEVVHILCNDIDRLAVVAWECEPELSAVVVAFGILEGSAAVLCDYLHVVGEGEGDGAECLSHYLAVGWSGGYEFEWCSWANELNYDLIVDGTCCILGYTSGDNHIVLVAWLERNGLGAFIVLVEGIDDDAVGDGANAPIGVDNFAVLAALVDGCGEIPIDGDRLAEVNFEVGELGSFCAACRGGGNDGEEWLFALDGDYNLIGGGAGIVLDGASWDGDVVGCTCIEGLGIDISVEVFNPVGDRVGASSR